MTALRFRTGWGEVRRVPVYLGEEVLSPLQTERTRLDALRQRHWAAMEAEVNADPCTLERALLGRRTDRLARLVRAVAKRLDGGL